VKLSKKNGTNKRFLPVLEHCSIRKKKGPAHIRSPGFIQQNFWNNILVISRCHDNISCQNPVNEKPPFLP